MSRLSPTKSAKSSVFFLILVVCSAETALGQVTEPDGTLVPAFRSNDYWDTARFTEGTLSLQNLFNQWEGLGVMDMRTDASATNVTFAPLCGLNGAMILRGGSCQVDFGWYCTDDPEGSEVIHPLVTAADVVTYHDTMLPALDREGEPPAAALVNDWAQLQNNDKGFVPTIQSGFLAPVQGSQSLVNVREDPDYANCPSGKIGFAFRGVAASYCPQSKFSEPHRNLMSSYGSPWINVLVYQSKVSPGTYYIAFEDLPMSAGNFAAPLNELQAMYPQMPTPSWTWTGNDGDFNDFVYVVQGITCEGGGQPCTAVNPDTNQPYLGACGIGVTACSTVPGETGACQPRVGPVPEVCDNIDNDCDGLADDTDEGPLCPTGQVCLEGQCIEGCQSGEFPCDPGFNCIMEGDLLGYCVEEACAGVVCPANERCVGGVCLGACTNKVCPAGSECIAGACVDLCAGVSCPETYVCERGACIPDCMCLPCTDPVKTVCGSDGHCIDPLCAEVTCPEYQACQAGNCVDPCLGVNCGTGIDCVATIDGHATCPGGAIPVDGAGGSMINLEGQGGDFVTGSAGTSSSVESGGIAPAPDDGCNCRVAGTQRRMGWFGLLGLMVLPWLRRRPSAQH